MAYFSLALKNWFLKKGKENIFENTPPPPFIRIFRNAKKLRKNA